MTSPFVTDHSETESIRMAAEWLAPRCRADLEKPIFTELRLRFGLTAAQIIEAVSEANEIRRRGASA